MMGNKTLIAALLAVCGTVVFATSFPNADGSGDIASPAAWGGVLPTDQAQFQTSDVTNTASANVTFAGVEVGAKNVVFDFSQTPARTITLSDHFRPLNYTGASYTLRGGTWNLSGKNFHLYHNWGQGSECTVTLENGCNVTNVGWTLLNFSTLKCHLIIRDQASLTVNTYDSNSGHGNDEPCLEVLSGGRLSVPATGSTLRIGDGTTLVSGAGSRIESYGGAGDFTLGNTFHNTLIRITDGGAFDAAALRMNLNLNNATNTTIVVDDDGTFQCGEVYPNGRAFNIQIGERGQMTTGRWYIRGNDHSVRVLNGTLKGSRWIGEAASGASVTNFSVAVIGSDAQVDIAGGDALFMGLSDSSILLEGASWSCPVTYWKSRESSNCTFRLTQQAAFTTTGHFWGTAYDGGSASLTNCNGNVISVESGSTFQSAGFTFVGKGNRLIVTNATFRCPTGSFNFGRSDRGSDENQLVLQGTTPRVEIASDAMHLRYGSTLRVEMPAEGYAADFVPITTAWSLSLDDSCHLVADVEAIRRHQRVNKTYVLARANGGVSIPESVLAEANAVAPDEWQFGVSEDNKSLTLRVMLLRGMAVMLK